MKAIDVTGYTKIFYLLWLASNVLLVLFVQNINKTGIKWFSLIGIFFKRIKNNPESALLAIPAHSIALN